MIRAFASHASGVPGADSASVGKKCSVTTSSLITRVTRAESCKRTWELNNLHCYYWDKLVVPRRRVHAWDTCWRGFLYVLHVFCTSVSDVPRQFLARLNATKSRLASMTRQYFYCKQCTRKLPRDYNNLRNTRRVPKLSTISPAKLKKKKLFELQITWLFSFNETIAEQSKRSEIHLVVYQVSSRPVGILF